METAHFVPGERKSLHFLRIKRALYRHLIILTICFVLGKRKPSDMVLSDLIQIILPTFDKLNENE